MNDLPPPLYRNRLKHFQNLLALSALTLIITVWSTVSFLAYQNSQLDKHLKTNRGIQLSNKPQITPTPNEEPPGFVGYNPDGKRFSLIFPDTCITTDRGRDEGHFDRFLVTCVTDNFKITINPQEGGRGLGDYQPAEIKSGKINVDNYIWKYKIWIDPDKTAFSSYELTDPTTKDYYLIRVNYYPYSEKAKAYFDQILSTFKFLEKDVSISPAPTKALTKTLSYILPSGWQTIKDKDNIFSVGYNPENYNPIAYESRIDLSSKQCCTSTFLQVKPYDGGSKQKFISEFTQYSRTNTTYETDYSVQGKSGLIIYAIEYSGTYTVGMVDIDGKNALLITSQAGQETVEQVLQTLKFD
ncbi:MAG TPA: hypothetical protein VI819_03115 [Patescibacteria group bacterium]|nr:hypothetical protein [Patescibacteria group bacterium]